MTTRVMSRRPITREGGPDAAATASQSMCLRRLTTMSASRRTSTRPRVGTRGSLAPTRAEQTGGWRSVARPSTRSTYRRRRRERPRGRPTRRRPRRPCRFGRRRRLRLSSALSLLALWQRELDGWAGRVQAVWLARGALGRRSCGGYRRHLARARPWRLVGVQPAHQAAAQRIAGRVCRLLDARRR